MMAHVLVAIVVTMTRQFPRIHIGRVIVPLLKIADRIMILVALLKQKRHLMHMRTHHLTFFVITPCASVAGLEVFNEDANGWVHP